jgi:hypothetical protein
MIAVPEGGERGDFGVAVTTDSSLGADDLAACARKAIAARGGKPSTAARGTFTVVADDADPAQAQLALHPGGPFLVGRGPWLDAMIAAVEGRGGRAAPEHAALRAALGAALESAGSVRPAFAATVLLPKSLRDRLRSEEGEREGKDAGASGQAAFLGVLAVDRAGLAIAPSGGDGGSTTVALELRCDAADGAERCADVKKLIERGRRALAQNFVVHLSGAGPLLDTLQIDVNGGALSARAHAPTDDLARALASFYPRLGPSAPPPAVSSAATGPSPSAPPP